MRKMKSSGRGDGDAGEGWWESLPPDLVARIVSKQTAADHRALLSTCKSMRDVVSSVGPSHGPDQLPFLLLPPVYTVPDPLFLRIPWPPAGRYPLGPIVRFPRRDDRRNADSPAFPLGRLDRPAFRPLPSLVDTGGHVCVGSSHGWLVLLGPTSHISLLNPLTSAALTLPPPLCSARRLFPGLGLGLDLVLDDDDDRSTARYLLLPPPPGGGDGGGSHRRLHLAALVRFAVLSADPSRHPGSFLLLVVLGNSVSSTFLTCGPSNGYAAWKPHHLDPGFPAYGITDLTFHDGLCFAAVMWRLDGLDAIAQNFIAVFDFSARQSFRRLLDIQRGNNDDPAHDANFLVESAGELLLVKKVGQVAGARISIFSLPSIGGDDGPIVPVPKVSLGDRALFLGMGNSLSVPARDFPRFVRGNAVYFTDVYHKVVLNNTVVNVGCVYAFDVEQGVARKAFEVAELRDMNMWLHLRPWWVTPNLHRSDP